MTSRGNLGGCILCAVSGLCFLTHKKGWIMVSILVGRSNLPRRWESQDWGSKQSSALWRQWHKWCICLEKGMWEFHSLHKGRKPVPWGIRGMMKAEFVWQHRSYKNPSAKWPLGTKPRCRKVLAGLGAWLLRVIAGKPGWAGPGAGPEERETTWPGLYSWRWHPC